MALYQRLWLDEFDRLYEGFTKTTPNSSQVIRQLPVYGLADITIPDTINSALWTGETNAPMLSYPLNQANVVRVTTCLRDATATANTGAGSWTHLYPSTTPTALSDFTLVYDVTNNRTVLFGGTQDGTGVMGETWVYDGSDWDQLSPATSPSARSSYAACWDAANGYMLLFGGWTGAATNGETWKWDGTTWTNLSPGTAPTARDGAVMCYDSTRGEVVLFGGRTSGTTVSNQTWTWDGSTWTQESPGTSPTARTQASFAFDATNTSAVLYGGHDGSSNPITTTYLWDGSDWTNAAPATTPNISYYGGDNTAIWHATYGKVLLIGSDYNGGANDPQEVWEWTGTDWSLTVAGGSYAFRSYFGCAYSVTDDKVYSHGGWDESDVQNADTWELSGLGAGGESETGLWLGTSNQNLYWIAWRPGDGKCVTNRIIGGTATAGDTTAGTLTAPLYLRLTLNRGAGTVVAEYSDAGSSWTTLTTWSSISIVPSTFGLFARNLDPYPAVWGAYDWIGVELLPSALQYRPVATRQTSSNDALAVRAVRDLARAIDNAKAFALNHKRWSYCWPAGAKLSTAAGTGEKVILCFAPRYLPEGYNLLRVTVGHERFAGTGTTTWRLYATKYIYRGATTIQSSFLCADYDAEDIATTSSDTHAISYTEALKAVREGNTGDCYLLLTANNSDGTTQSRLTTLDVTPMLNIAEQVLDTAGLL